MQPQWLPEQSYHLPLVHAVHGSRDRHATLSGRLIGYGTPGRQVWMTAADLPSRPQWYAAIDQFARALVQDQYRALCDDRLWSAEVAALWRTTPRTQVPLALTVDEYAALGGKLADLLEKTGATAVKIKVTAATALPQLLQVLAPWAATVELRLDANQCWKHLSSKELQAVLQQCQQMGIASVEDPTTPERWPEHAPLPLAADLVDSDLPAWQQLLRSGRAHIAVVKPSLFGTLAALGETLHELADLGIPVVFSSLFDAPIGLAQLAVLAACAPGQVLASGLATHLDLDPRWYPPQLAVQHGNWQLANLEQPLPLPCTDPCAQAAAQRPAGLALRYVDTQVLDQTWQQLDHDTDAMAAWLADRGVAPGTLVATWAENQPALLVLALAVWRLGSCWLPLHPRWTATETAAMLGRVPTALLLVDPTHAALMPKNVDVLVLPLPNALPRRDPPRRWLDPQAAALLVATSGTTGVARLVTHTPQTLQAAAAAHWALWPDRECNWLLCLPFSHVSGVSILLRTAAVAGTLTLAAHAEAGPLLAQLHAQQPTHLSIVPLQLAKLTDLGAPPSSLRWVLVGGASIDPQLLERARQVGWPAVPSWGMSETVGQAATGDLGQPSQEVEGLRRVGPPLPGVWLRIAEPSGPEGVGEIELAALQRMVGHLGQPPVSTQEFWPTGDLGALDAAGVLWVASRRADRIVVAGENVDPLEIEAILAQLPGVLDVAVVGTAAGARGEVVAALLQIRPNELVSPHTALQMLAPFKRPQRWLLTTEPLPRNAMGKLVRPAIRALLKQYGLPAPHWPSAAEPVTK